MIKNVLNVTAKKAFIFKSLSIVNLKVIKNHSEYSKVALPISA